MRPVILYCSVIVLVQIVFACDVYGQVRREYQEVWPSVDAYYRMTPKLRLYGTMAATKKESSYSEGALGLFVDYFTFPITRMLRINHADSLPGRMLWIRAGYQYSATPQSAEDPFKESMFVTEFIGRVDLPYQVLLTLRNRFDWRFNSGEFNGRYRPRLVLDKDLKTEYMFFTLSAMVEYFANFGNGSIDRFRTQVGVDFRVTRTMNFEVFWNHQFENAPEIPKVDAFGTTVKFYFKKNTASIKSNR